MVLPGVSQIQRNHGKLEVHWSSKLSPDLKNVPDWVESVMASLPVTVAPQERNNANILNIMPLVHWTPSLPPVLFLPKEKRRYEELRVCAGWLLSGRKVTHLAER